MSEEMAKEEVNTQDAAQPSMDELDLGSLKEKAERFDSFQARYKSDPHFREVVDGAWGGKKYQEFVEQVQKQQDAIDDPVQAIKKELLSSKDKELELRKELDEIKNFITTDKTSANREKVISKYEDEFMELAESAGYTPGTPAYEVLFDNAEKAGFNLAQKKGIGNWLDKYHPGFIRQAFDEALSKHKRAGFDEAWKAKSRMMREEERKKNTPKNPMDDFFDKNKEKFKTSEGRRAGAEEYFRKLFSENSNNF